MEETVETADITALEPLPGAAREAFLDIRPKERQLVRKPLADQEKSEAEQGRAGEMEWSLGPSGTGDYRAPPPPGPMLTPSGAHFAPWWERRILDDGWSYSTAVGSQTMEVLQEMFGAAGFSDPGHGSGWRGTTEVGHPSHEAQHPGGVFSHFQMAISDRPYDMKGQPRAMDQRPTPDVTRVDSAKKGVDP